MFWLNKVIHKWGVFPSWRNLLGKPIRDQFKPTMVTNAIHFSQLFEPSTSGTLRSANDLEREMGLEREPEPERQEERQEERQSERDERGEGESGSEAESESGR